MGHASEDHLQLSLTTLLETEGLASQIDVPPERQFVGFEAFQQVLASGVDVVLLATPPHFRPMHLKAAVEAGKHVFAEKPCAVDACMTLPYSAFPLERALIGIKAAGYHYVAWGTRHREENGEQIPVIADDAPPEKAKALGKRCRDLGLEPVMMFSDVYPESNRGLEVLTHRIKQAAAAPVSERSITTDCCNPLRSPDRKCRWRTRTFSRRWCRVRRRPKVSMPWPAAPANSLKPSSRACSESCDSGQVVPSLDDRASRHARHDLRHC